MNNEIRDRDWVNVRLALVQVQVVEEGSIQVTIPGIEGRAFRVPLVDNDGAPLTDVTIEQALPDARPGDLLVARAHPTLGRFFVHYAGDELCVTMGDGNVSTLVQAVRRYGPLVLVDLSFDDPPMYADLAGGHEPAGEFRPFEPAMERHPGDEGTFDRPVPVSDRTQVLPAGAVLPPARGTAAVS